MSEKQNQSTHENPRNSPRFQKQAVAEPGSRAERVFKVEEMDAQEKGRPNLAFNAGKEGDSEVTLDLKKQDLNLILLVGESGSGKSIAHFNLYRQLLEQNTPEELGFMLIDNTRVDFYNFHSAYLIKLCKLNDEAIEMMATILEEVRQRNSGEKDKTKAIIVHIEECNQFAQDPIKTEEFFREFIRLKRGSNIYVVYSTSRPSEAMLPDWLIEAADLQMIFKMHESEQESDNRFKLPVILTTPGQRFLQLDDNSFLLDPFSNEDIVGDEEFVNRK